MFLRNWDNYKTYEIMTANIALFVVPDSETYFKNYRGEYVQPPTQTSDYNYINWAGTSEGYYKDSPSGIFIWPGGKVNGQYTRPQPGIDNKVIKYEDHNLYSPFYGGYQEESGVHIYGQKHIGSGCKYNAADDTWEYTVTREFKNISGYEIEVEEMGYFGWNSSLMAKEVLTEPIIVQNDSYFKLSFTYKVKNPHENREINRIREIRYGGSHSSASLGNSKYRYSLSPSKNKKIIVFTQSEITYRNEDTFKAEMQLWEVKGWNRLQEPIVIPLENKRYVQIDFFEPDTMETENYIRKDRNYGYPDERPCFYYVSDNIESFSLNSSIKIAKEELVNSLEFSITPNLNKENRIYLILREYFYNYVSCSQLDEDRCDFFFSYNQYQNLFLDTTNALTHTFRSNFNDDNLWCLVLDPVMKIDANGKEVPLYHDEPVK